MDNSTVVDTAPFICWEQFMKILLFSKRSQLCLFSVFMGEKVEVAKILRSFSKLCVQLQTTKVCFF